MDQVYIRAGWLLYRLTCRVQLVLLAGVAVWGLIVLAFVL